MSNSVRTIAVRIGRKSILPFYLRYRRPLSPLKDLALMIPGFRNMRAALLEGESFPATDRSPMTPQQASTRGRAAPFKKGSLPAPDRLLTTPQKATVHRNQAHRLHLGLGLSRERLLQMVDEDTSDAGALAIARHLLRLKNFRSASLVAAKLNPYLLKPSELFVVMRSFFSSTQGVRADTLLEWFLTHHETGYLKPREQKELADLIAHSGARSGTKLSRLSHLLQTRLSDSSRRHVRFQEFRIRLEVDADFDLMRYVELDSIDFFDPTHQVRLVPYLKTHGYEDEAKTLLTHLYAHHGTGNVGVLLAILRFDHNWPEIDLGALPQSYLERQDILQLAHEHKESSDAYADLFSRSLNANIAAYSHADVYQKDRILGCLLRLGLIDQMGELTEGDPQLPNTVLSHHVAIGLRYFINDEFLSAKDRFLYVLEENPSDSVAAQGMRLALPRAGGDMYSIVALRDNIGYGITGAGRTGSRGDIGSDKTISLLMQGKYKEGLYTKRHAAHWKLLKRAYGGRFLNFERFEAEGKQGSLFVIGDEGVGDEVRTAQFYGTLIERFGQVTISCDPRLKTIFERSFPAATFIPVERYRKGLPKAAGKSKRISGFNLKLFQYLTEDCRPYLDGADYITFGQNLFFNRFIGEIPRPRSGGYLAVGKTTESSCRGKLQVGILWRSHFQSMWRKFMYLRVEDFAPIAHIDGVDLWAFQHCMNENEIAVCREYGIRLIEDLDMFNDFDGLAHRLAGMDLMVGISSLPIELAAAVGTDVWMLGFSPENYFLRTEGGRTSRDQLTANSTIVAPSWIDFTAPSSECITLVMRETRRRLRNIISKR